MKRSLMTKLILFGMVITSMGILNYGMSPTVAGIFAQVQATYPINGSSISSGTFTLRANTNSSFYDCFYNTDTTDTEFTMMTGSGSQFTSPISDLASGQHTIYIGCNSSITYNLNPIPKTYAQFMNSNVNNSNNNSQDWCITQQTFNLCTTTTFTVATSGGGGSPMYTTCRDNMCVYVSGTGQSTCYTNADCAPKNKNMNNTPPPSNQNVNSQNENLNLNIHSSGNTSGTAGEATRQCANNPGVTTQEIEQMVERFVDLPLSHWGAGFMTRAVKENFFHGDPGKNTIRPDDKTTRAEYAKVVTLLFKKTLPTVLSNPFVDVSRRSWYAVYVLVLKNAGITSFDDGTFRPMMFMTRAETMTELVLLGKIDVSNVDVNKLPFTDIPKDAPYAKAVAWAYENCIINGRSSTLFEPNDMVTRAELAKIVVLVKDLLGL